MRIQRSIFSVAGFAILAVPLATALGLLSGCHSSSGASGPPPGIYCHATIGPETVCYGYSNLTAEQKTAVSDACTTSLQGTISGSCPSGQVGCCTTTTAGYGVSECYYAGTAQAYEQACTAQAGKWVGPSGSGSSSGSKGSDAGTGQEGPGGGTGGTGGTGGEQGSCAPSQTQCPKGCVDETSDVNNCGSCGYSCPAGANGTTPSCTAGKCTYACADPAETLCDAYDGQNDGQCINLQTSNDSCGQCDHPCYGSGGASASCQAGVCQSSCPQGQGMCSGQCIDIESDPSNCGGCGNTCAEGTVCTSGSCTTKTCSAGETLCEGNCSNLQSDTFNCGSCGNACQLGNFCTYGSCSLCPAGTAYCAGLCPSILTDPSNCGGCGISCPSGVCSGGACQ
jgi:hypothetical protein